jgi:hypothetical protein
MKHLYALIFILFTFASYAQSPYTTTGLSSDWNDDAAWSGVGIPGPGDDLTILDSHIIFTNGNQAAANITLEGSAILNINSFTNTLNVSNNVTLEGTALIAGALGQINVGNSLFINGTNSIGAVGVDVTSSLIISDGARLDFTSIIGDKQFSDVIMDGASLLIFRVAETINISNMLQMNGTAGISGVNGGAINSSSLEVTGVATLSALSIDVSGLTTVDSGAAILFRSIIGDKNFSNFELNGLMLFTSAEQINISGTLTMNPGSGSSGSSPPGMITATDLVVNGTGSSILSAVGVTVTNSASLEANSTLVLRSTVGDKVFNSLTIENNASLTYTSSETLTVTTDLTMNGMSSVTGTSIGTFISNNASFLGTNTIGPINFTTNTLGFVGDGAVLTYTSIAGDKNFQDLTLTGTGAIEFNQSETIIVNNLLTMNGTSTLGGGLSTGLIAAQEFDVNGNNTFGSLLTGVAGTFTLNGSLGFSSTVGTFTTNNMVMAGSDLTLPYDFEITGELDLRDDVADIDLSASDLNFGPNAFISGGSANSYIKQTGTGRVNKEYPTAGFGNAFELPFGDASIYAPIIMGLNSGTNIGPNGLIEYEFVNANGHPNRDNDNTASGGDDDATGGTVATDYLNDYWRFTTTDITDINFTFLGDFNQGGFVGSTFSMSPTILRVGTPPGGSQTIDWHVVGANEAFGTGFVLPGIVAMIDVNNAGNQLNESNTWELYAMDNGLNGSGVERLPITLVSFDAEQKNTAVELNWVTADEVNNDFFTIERSTDGQNFTPIITVDGAGDSQTELSYTALDVAPVEGINYYRLKQTDFSGEFEYSEIERVNFTGPTESPIELKAYPNPLSVGAYLNISGLEGINVARSVYKVISNAGQQLESGGLQELVDGRVRLNQKGMHFIQIIHPEGQEVLKILVN